MWERGGDWGLGRGDGGEGGLWIFMIKINNIKIVMYIY
jgi:hypothetical protein